MKEVLAEAFEYTCNHMQEYWLSHYPGYIRVFVAIVIAGIVGTIAAEIYGKIDAKRAVKTETLDAKKDD